MMNFESIFKLADSVDGVFVDVGTGYANSAREIVDLMSAGKIQKREGYLVDSFSGIPSPTSKDLSYNPNLKEGANKIPPQNAFDTRYLLPGYDFWVVKEYIENTNATTFKDKQVAVAHIDVELYSSTYNALEKLIPLLNLYSTIAVTGYKDNNAVSEAVDDFLSNKNLTYLKNLNSAGDLYLYNIKAPVVFGKASSRRDNSPTPEMRVPTKTKPVVEPFEDRYKKPVIEKFIPKKEIKQGLQVIGKKVTK